ncbi:MAG: hypothetical protein DRO90_00135 [Candidatus Altiarchaeales archaeon]|nr:MAG: hypothetical protein DRO95_00330 [Candidatus Altiarchaeales archaeon]RLI94492.1 MAG: hypothetical protein DRO94_02815 [Candidatus Altiarchaeales archaeon]RLI95571.1 MAG: hypothetical protein DRO90_00135 [Candidatus Altiarchaeales archaeon]HDO82593.1 hypothetical protein [Candidatus Altiarchaeales archaeon]HEX55242.1 hypothetical protein [Candidatus Altiarchaeales archaeon]
MVKKTKKHEKISKADAERFLQDVPAEKCFWANNGWIIRNLRELPIALENMSDETFFYHCNKEKNDFYNWIKDVIGYEELAERIKNVKTKKSMMNRVKKAIRELENA